MSSVRTVLIKHTHGQPGYTQHSVELPGRRAVEWSGVSGKLKVENEHDDLAIFVLHWNHIYYTVETHSCSNRDTEDRRS